MAAKKPPQRTAYRDDGDGQFISEKKYKKANQNTVTKEKVPVRTPQKKSK